MTPVDILKLISQLQGILGAVESMHNLLLDSLPPDEQLDIVASMDGPEMMPLEDDGGTTDD